RVRARDRGKIFPRADDRGLRAAAAAEWRRAGLERRCPGDVCVTQRLAVIGAIACVVAALASITAAAAAGFKRGATLVEFFGFPATTQQGGLKAYADPPFPQAQAALETFDFDSLRRMGFDHMRIPVDTGPLMRADEGRRRDFLRQLGAVIARLHRHGLGAIVTLHPPSLNRELPETYLDGLDGPKFRRYGQLVQGIAAELA